MKKTNKENPLTSFRKMYEAREKTVKSSLKKAQNGIQVNATSTDPVRDYDKQMLVKQQYENMRIRNKEIEAYNNLVAIHNKYKNKEINRETANKLGIAERENVDDYKWSLDPPKYIKI